MFATRAQYAHGEARTSIRELFPFLAGPTAVQPTGLTLDIQPNLGRLATTLPRCPAVWSSAKRHAKDSMGGLGSTQAAEYTLLFGRTECHAAGGQSTDRRRIPCRASVDRPPMRNASSAQRGRRRSAMEATLANFLQASLPAAQPPCAAPADHPLADGNRRAAKKPSILRGWPIARRLPGRRRDPVLLF